MGISRFSLARYVRLTDSADIGNGKAITITTIALLAEFKSREF